MAVVLLSNWGYLYYIWSWNKEGWLGKNCLLGKKGQLVRKWPLEKRPTWKRKARTEKEARYGKIVPLVLGLV